jgi:phage shock protein C
VNRRSLYRCRHDQRLAGVAGGVAEFFDLDPTLVRIVWVLSILFGGFGLLLYIVMAIIVPLEPEGTPAPDGARVASHRHERGSRTGGLGMPFLGLVLILFGTLALADSAFPYWADRGGFLWPAFILGLGVLLMLGSMRRERPEGADRPAAVAPERQPLQPAPPEQ